MHPLSFKRTVGIKTVQAMDLGYVLKVISAVKNLPMRDCVYSVYYINNNCACTVNALHVCLYRNIPSQCLVALFIFIKVI